MIVKSQQVKHHMIDLKETFQILRKYQMRLNLAKCAFDISSKKFLDFMILHCGIEAKSEKLLVILEMLAPRIQKEVQCLVRQIAALSRFVTQLGDKCITFFRTLR